jgi:hypothetical protein
MSSKYSNLFSSLKHQTMEISYTLVIFNACPYIDLVELTTPQHRNFPYIAVLLKKKKL